jgi:hypothetical protein
MINAQDFTGAADQFLRWNRSGGNVMAGLTSRRIDERELFLAIVRGIRKNDTSGLQFLWLIIWSNWMTYKAFLFIFFIVMSIPAIAQEKLILMCDVNFERTNFEKNNNKTEKGNDRIQIDITSYELLKGHQYEELKYLLEIDVKGSLNLELSFWAPPEGKGRVTLWEGETTNKSNDVAFYFDGFIPNIFNRKKPRGFILQIDRVTGLVRASYLESYPAQTVFTGTCKKLDPQKRAF